MGTPAALTPMLAQYLELKRQYSDSILFYRMGDFYEMFFEDALTAAPILDVQLTARDKNAESPIPMCGVPHHSALGYIQKLLAHGMKVALCEQMEDPATTKGLVKRDVVRVLTPGLVGDPDLVGEEKNTFLVAIAQGVGVCVLNLLDNQLRVGEVASIDHLKEVFGHYRTTEILVAHEGGFKVPLGARVTVRDKYFDAQLPAAKAAHQAVIHYLKRESLKLESFTGVRAYSKIV